MSPLPLRNGVEHPEEPIGRRRLLLMTLAVFAFVVGVYLPSYRYGLLFDESVILFRTVPPRTVGELLERLWAPHFPGLEYFRPVPHATYLVQYMWDRNDPGAFHVFNALMMGVTACVAFAMLRLACFRIRTLPAALAAVLFAVHPASSSCVTPIVGRETLIGACLTISAVYAFFRAGRFWYVASLFLLALALLSKEQAVVTPALFFLGDLLGLSKDAPGRDTGRWLRRHAPPLLILTVYLGMRWTLFSGTEYALQIFEHPLGPLQSVAYAVQTIFTPFGELAYEPALGVWLSFHRLALAGILLAALVWTVTRHCRAARSAALFWLGWILVTIAPTANVIEQQAPYSERYILLATFAVVAVAAAVASTIPDSPRTRFWTAVVGLAVIVPAAAVTVHRGRCFENALTFSRQWAKTSPTFGEARMALGVELHLRGRTDDAADCFRAGAECGPAVRGYCRQWLGKMLIVQGRFAEAEHQFQLLADESGVAPYSRYLSGIAFRALGDTKQAVARLEQAVEIDPRFGSAHFLLADTYALQKNTSLATRHRSIASQASAIDLSFARVTDSHLRDLSSFPRLNSLLLESTLISDAGLQHLRSMTTLNRLWLPGTAVTDGGLIHLRSIPNLNSLVLTNTQVSDDSVPILVSMSGLRHLDVRNTGITREGFRKLKNGLPECLILH